MYKKAQNFPANVFSTLFKQVFCSKKQIPVQIWYVIYFGQTSHNIQKTHKLTQEFVWYLTLKLFWHWWTGFHYRWLKTETSKKNLLLSFGFVMISICFVGLLKLLHNIKNDLILWKRSNNISVVKRLWFFLQETYTWLSFVVRRTEPEQAWINLVPFLLV